MTELAFFKRGPGLSIGEIVAVTGAAAMPGVALDYHIDGVAPLDTAGPRDLTFIDSTKYSQLYAATQAGVCLTTLRLADQSPAGVRVLATDNPYVGFVTVAQKLFPGAMRPSTLFEADGHSVSASIHPTARLENAVNIEPGAVIGPRAEIGANTIIGPTAVIGSGVRIGRDCVIGPGAVVTNALIGDRVILHSGCRIGQDGFGYQAGSTGLRKIPQIGRVIIQDDVEIGANTTIDRGGMRDTVIGEGTKIDNLVQIGHNVSIGRQCVIVSQTGLSGSVTVGDHAMLGGQVGVADHVVIGEGAQLEARSGVISNVPAGERWGGFPAQRGSDWLRGVAAVRKLGKRGSRADNGETAE